MANQDSKTTVGAGPRLAWVGPRWRSDSALPWAVTVFEDSDDFLLSAAPFDFEVFVIRSSQHGVGGLDLIRIIRRRTTAGILALCDRPRDDFASYLDGGADMVLGMDVPLDHLRAGISALARRAGQGRKAEYSAWKLLESQATLETPEGAHIPLSETDLTILRCFAANGGKAERGELIERLWGAEAAAMDNALHATVYRLRKRIEQAGQARAPLHAVSRVGYEFRAPLVVLGTAQAAGPAEGSNIRRSMR